MILVVARYDENLDWVSKFARVFVHDQSKDKNVGREAYVYLKYTLDHWDRFCKGREIVVFTQARWDDHVSRDTFENDICKGRNAHVVRGLDTHWDSTIVQRYGLSLDPAGETLGDFFKKYVFSELPPEKTVAWARGAIFACTRPTKPKETYESLLGLLTTNDTEYAHYLERAWLYLFE